MSNYGYRQVATYWSNPVSDGFGGYTYDAPVAILCHWKDKTERVTDERGNEVVSKAVVYTDSELAVGGLLYKGELLNIQTDPKELDTETIMVIVEVPDLRNVCVERRYYL